MTFCASPTTNADALLSRCYLASAVHIEMLFWEEVGNEGYGAPEE
jgi:hypothetical protein